MKFFFPILFFIIHFAWSSEKALPILNGQTNVHSPEATLPDGHPPIDGSAGVIDAPSLSVPMPASSQELSWTLPDGWKEVPGSGMRVATLQHGSSDAGDISVIRLSGSGGGLEGNLVRWAAQVGTKLDRKSLDEFVSRQKKFKSVGGYEVFLADFESLLKDKSAHSLLAAVVPVGTGTWFFKLAGKKEALADLALAFEAVVKSLAPKVGSSGK